LIARLQRAITQRSSTIDVVQHVPAKKKETTPRTTKTKDAGKYCSTHRWVQVQQHQQIRRRKKEQGKGEEKETSSAMSYHNNGHIRGASQFNSY
jgi:3-mercaptopyruvate sulfurtransferase SseA